MEQKEFYNDDTLVQGLRRGEEKSFTAIYHKYAKELFYKAEAILGNELLAEDCVQDVFMNLWKRKGEVEIENLAHYLRKAIRFKSIDIIRSKKVYYQYAQRIAEVTTTLFLQQPILLKELEAIFRDALQSLPKDQQEIFALAREKGMTYRQIAELKGISVKTVEKKMSLSLRLLKFRLGDLLNSFL